MKIDNINGRVLLYAEGKYPLWVSFEFIEQVYRTIEESLDTRRKNKICEGGAWRVESLTSYDIEEQET